MLWCVGMWCILSRGINFIVLLTCVTPYPCANSPNYLHISCNQIVLKFCIIYVFQMFWYFSELGMTIPACAYPVLSGSVICLSGIKLRYWGMYILWVEMIALVENTDTIWLIIGACCSLMDLHSRLFISSWLFLSCDMIGIHEVIFLLWRGSSAVFGGCKLLSASTCGVVKGILLCVSCAWCQSALSISLGDVGCGAVLSMIVSATLATS